ncbi:unnamed protein product [Rhizoctonia solani]|uniref:Nephrocystin 3-like N-terminal domain-containing protein n=1 Tax=Rhizoctonia solani TaxID=456999 RepID=A0A8H3ADF1_9AGAM|nr:unnamed protein product [Rhizoctonia solani]
MPLRDKIRKFKSDAKSRIFGVDEVKDGTHAGAGRTTTTPVPVPDTTHNWTQLRALIRVLEQAAKPLPALKAAVTGIAECVGIYESVTRQRKEYEVLYKELEELFQALRFNCTENASPAITSTVEALCGSIQYEIIGVRQKLGQGKQRAYLEAEWQADAVLACYRRIQLQLQRISLNMDMAVWRIVDETAVDNRLKHLSPSLSARYNSAQAIELKRGPCTTNTRVDLLSQMLDWVDNSDPGSVYWMNGMAGTGKTTVAYSLCLELETGQRLGASFFCSRLLPECRNINLIVPSIAYQLARFSRPFRFVLSSILEKDPDVHTQLPLIQFDSLIVQPLLQVKDTLPESLVVVIDALDECDNKESMSQILEVLLTRSLGLPVKFVVSSRPEPQIRDEMAKQTDQIRSRVVLHELNKNAVQADIETYLRVTLAQIQPTEDQITTLVEQAGILFIYAATVARYISHDRFRRNPRARLTSILESSRKSENKHIAIDELYAIILRAAFDDDSLEDHEREDMKQVLHTIMCAYEPLTVEMISMLLNINDLDRVHAALRPLWSVLHISGANELVTTLHASFSDYMLDPLRSKDYHCDPKAHNQALARLCFDCFRITQPQFNICGLQSSYILDNHVEGIEERIQAAISPNLFYAARYWAAHLQSASESRDLIEELEVFLSRRFLLWMEVMNLKKCAGTIPQVISRAAKWEAGRSIGLSMLIHDAFRFASTFAISAVSSSTPHIYTSMLLFWPESSPISKCYATRTQGAIKVEGKAIDQTQHALLATWSFDHPTISPTFSPDSMQIAVGLGPTILLLSALTGQKILPPFEGHSSDVASIRFAPDGTRIISCSIDGTIRVWSAQSGEMLLGPLCSHIGYSANFSPDGTRIVSVSFDGLLVWDASTGQLTSSSFVEDEHQSRPTAPVKYSPDGNFIICSNSAGGIQIHDAKDGKVSRTFDPSDYTYTYSSFDVSPDGARLASVSSTDTIRIWDFRTGRELLGPLSIAPSSPYTLSQSVSFSPDGLYLVSDFSNGAICMWDTQSGNLVLGPLRTHTNHTTSSGFSPDGNHIISGSSDNTLRLWDTRARSTNKTPVPSPSPGHTGPIQSARFSPDGTRIISEAPEYPCHNMCIWDAESGEMVLGPLENSHSGGLPPVYSPKGDYIIWENDYGLVLLDAQTGDVTRSLLKCGRVSSVRFSPDNTCIIIGSWENKIRILAADTGHSLMVIHIPSINLYHYHTLSTTFSPDGKTVAILSNYSDGFSKHYEMRIYDTCSGQLLYDKSYGDSGASSFRVGISPEGTQLASTWESAILVQDTRTGEKKLGPLKGHTGWIQSVEFSRDGTKIVSGGGDHAICVWDAQTGHRIFGPIKWHTDSVHSVSFSPDGTQVVSGSEDKTIRVTDIQATPALLPNCAPMGFGEWELREDGWVVDDSSRLLVWIPPGLRTTLMFPRTKLLISTQDYLRLNFEGAYIGESWGKCYQPV